MAGDWVFQMDRLPSLLAAIVLLALVAWLLWFDFETRLHRAFALLLFLKAFFLGLVTFGISALDMAIVLRMYFAIGIPFAALYFALVFRSHYAPKDRPRPPPTWPWAVGLTLAAGAFVLLFVLRRDLYHDGTSAGPLSFFAEFSYMAFAFIAIMFARLAITQRPGRRRSALLLGTLAFSLEAIYQATVQVLFVPISIGVGATSWQSYLAPLRLVFPLIWVAAAILLLILVGLLWRASRYAEPAARGDTRRALRVMLLPVAAGLLTLTALTLDRTIGTRLFIDLHWGMDALWVVAGAALIVYAVVQHHFLDSRRRLRGTVRTSTLVGVLLVLFFVVKELLEEVLEERYPIIPGLAAAVIAVALLHPILIVVGRLVRKWMPATAALSNLKPNERFAVYRSQVEVVWMDGVVTRKERSLLDRMRDRLEVPAEAAERIEREVMEEMAPKAASPPQSR